MNKSNFKRILIAVICIVVLALVISGWLYFKYKKSSEIKLTPEQQKVQEQLKQLDALRQQYNLQPTTPEQAQTQLEQLNKLREKHLASTSTPVFINQKMTQQQIKQQLDELQKLKK